MHVIDPKEVLECFILETGNTLNPLSIPQSLMLDTISKWQGLELHRKEIKEGFCPVLNLYFGPSFSYKGKGFSYGHTELAWAIAHTYPNNYLLIYPTRQYIPEAALDRFKGLFIQSKTVLERDRIWVTTINSFCTRKKDLTGRTLIIDFDLTYTHGLRGLQELRTYIRRGVPDYYWGKHYPTPVIIFGD